MANSSKRPGGYLSLVDEEGCRHLVRKSAIQMLSDSDPCHDSVTMVVAGRGLRIPRPLEEFLRAIESA